MKENKKEFRIVRKGGFAGNSPVGINYNYIRENDLGDEWYSETYTPNLLKM